ncbi:MAG: hypothetical protein NC355_02750 [Blautia sp.]|nr:hypothetical protein [Blautia sp.]
MLSGVYTATRKDGTLYYRSSITYQNKHISLGSYDTEEDAHSAYRTAYALLAQTQSIEDSFYLTRYLPFDKLVSLINYRDNRMYISTPIYLRKNYFSYYLDVNQELKFDIDDLFYYSSHRIMQRQGHLYVNDYGMQVTLQSRYGIKSHAVCGRDYLFVNGDSTDFRYSNIEIINPYFGVTRIEKGGQTRYRTKIHIRGNYTVGTYKNPEKAAIAYNKAVDMAHQAGIDKVFQENYIDSFSASEYADVYTSIKISQNYLDYLSSLSQTTSD